MRKFLIGLLFLLLAVPGRAQLAQIVYTPPHVYPFMTCISTACTSTVPILLSGGSTTAPGFAFSSDVDTGIWTDTVGTIKFTSGGTTDWLYQAGSLRFLNTFAVGWHSGAIGTAMDLWLLREGANTLQIGADAATAAAQEISAADSTGATVTGASLTLRGGAGTSGVANGGALILAGGAKSSTGEPGAVTISDGGTKPTCAAGIRGAIWYDAGGAGVADTLEVCAKSSLDAYAWVAFATPIS